MEFATIDPATNKVEKKYGFDSKEVLEQKLEKANTAYAAWRKLSIKERGEKIEKVAQLMEERKDEFAATLTKEMGKPPHEAQMEVKGAVDGLRMFIKLAEDALKPEIVEMGYKKAMTVYQPIGVIYSITPWNFPIIVPMQINVSSMLAGNTVLYKPAPSTPHTGELLGKLFADAGLDGEFGVTYASTDDTEFIISHKYVKGVNFTGSTAAGKIVASIAGKHMKKCHMELGGSDPFIVLDDADIEKAVQVVVMTRLLNCGQVCISPKRIIVLKDIYEEFKEKVVGTIRKVLETAQLGPIARADLHDGLKKQVLKTIEAGAKVAFGDIDQLNEPSGVEGKGNFFSPIVLEGVTKENPGFFWEFFGPVFVLYQVENQEEAVQLANAVEYGLGGAVFSKSEERAEQVAMEVETGSMTINAPFFPHFSLPFGGTKSSGYGRDGGAHGFQEFTNIKSVAIPN